MHFVGKGWAHCGELGTAKVLMHVCPELRGQQVIGGRPHTAETKHPLPELVVDRKRCACYARALSVLPHTDIVIGRRPGLGRSVQIPGSTVQISTSIGKGARDRGSILPLK